MPRPGRGFQAPRPGRSPMHLGPASGYWMTALAPSTWRSRWLVRHSGAIHADGAVVADARGVLAVAWGGEAARLVREARGPVIDIDGLLAPGLVVAHGHLELAHFAG